MSFIRVKVIDERRYLYEVKSVWNPKTQKNQQKVIRYIGSLEDCGDRVKRKDIFERDNYTCQLCGTKENLTLDHKTPLAKGGEHIDSNLWVLCVRCNTSKGKRILEINSTLTGETIET